MKDNLRIFIRIIITMGLVGMVCGDLPLNGEGTRFFPEKETTVRLSLDYYYEKFSPEDTIIAGEYDAKIGGGCRISNNAESGSSLDNLSITLSGNNFTKPAYEKVAIWDSASVKWIFPPDRTLEPGKSISGMYWNTDQYVKSYFPITLTRNVSPSEFTSQGLQNNNYTVIFQPSDASEYYGLITTYDDSVAQVSILNGSFWTDIPLKDYSYEQYYDDAVEGNRTTVSYHIDPASLTLQKPYHIGFLLDVNTSRPGDAVKIRPRFYLSKEQRKSKIKGISGQNGEIPKEYIRDPIISMSAGINKSVTWEYSQIIFTKLSFKRETTVGRTEFQDLNRVPVSDNS